MLAPYEYISDSEHEVVYEEMAAINLFRQAAQNGASRQLNRACYFSENGDYVDINRALENIKRRLNREVSAVFKMGTSYGFGLKPVMNYAPLAPYLGRTLFSAQHR